MSNVGINNQIAKNTLMLYLRMFLMMCISLYTSRVVLSVLGVDDYGIYNVVGGFVSMFSMISGAMVGATQRFISFELGRHGDVHKIFCTAVSIHIILALIILLIGETIGLWFVNNVLNFTSDRYWAANCVYQCSLFTFMINIISIPYNAAIVAYEKMAAFAYISIIEAILKLIIVYLLVISPFDKLVFYGFLMMLIAIIIRLVYGYYCRRHFVDCKYQWVLDKNLSKTILSYTGWNFLGTWAGAFRGQGVNMVINTFFGPAVNAAQGISNQVMGAIGGLVQNFQMAMNPQIIKRYAAGEQDSMVQLLFSGSRLSFILLLVVSVPIIIESDFVLDLWLKDVPEYSIEFLRLTIIVSLVDALSRNLVTAMQASGVVRGSNIAMFVISFFAIPIAYLLFTLGFPPYYSSIGLIVISLCCLWARVIILSHIMDFPMRSFFFNVVFRMVSISVIIIGFGFILGYYINTIDSVGRHICSMIGSFMIGVIISMWGGLTKDERNALINKCKNYLKSING